MEFLCCYWEGGAVCGVHDVSVRVSRVDGGGAYYGFEENLHDRIHASTIPFPHWAETRLAAQVPAGVVD